METGWRHCGAGSIAVAAVLLCASIYLPCKKGRRAGLYDKVLGTISFSYSDENFIAGPELVTEPSDVGAFVRVVIGVSAP